MAGGETGILQSVLLFVVVLLAVHVVALVYFLFKLGTQKPPERKKIH